MSKFISVKVFRGTFPEDEKMDNSPDSLAHVSV